MSDWVYVCEADLQEGELRGVKVGEQWMFEIEVREGKVFWKKEETKTS